MGNRESSDPFASTEEEVEVDAETAAAIERGIQAADEGRVVTLEETHLCLQQWLSKSLSPNQH